MLECLLMQHRQSRPISTKVYEYVSVRREVLSQGFRKSLQIAQPALLDAGVIAAGMQELLISVRHQRPGFEAYLATQRSAAFR